ncbi:MAG TPA: DUF5681 domain-containing protein [Rhizomicrobium sp.]|nr:DUF5681 domain-containing protein [Rhizomicrobium sp.]
MTLSTAGYTIGRGKPPLHTRFQKGQSGNPSGKPGPAKLAKMRFRRALYAALEGSPEEIELSKPETSLAAIARQMALDAAAGRVAAQRLVLSLLDAESAGQDKEASARERNEADPFSLRQGVSQGRGEQWLEDILWPDEPEMTGRSAGGPRGECAREPAPTAAARERGGVDPFSLVQGVSQGRGEQRLEGILWPEESETTGRNSGGSLGECVKEPAPAAPARERNGAQPFSLLQGKTQGSAKNREEQICAALGAGRVPAMAPAHTGMRARLMMGTSAAPSGDAIRFGLSPPAGRRA